MTRRQVPYWRDTITLFTRTVALTSGNYIAHNSLGFAWFQEGPPGYGQALANLRLAVAAKPDYVTALNNLGAVLIRMGRTEEALQSFVQAEQARPPDADARYNAGTALMTLGRWPEAAQHLRDAIAVSPDHGQARYNLAVSLYYLRRPAEAWREISWCREHGWPVRQDLLENLSRLMPEPAR
jgi:Flp pilus assembly protein TadD